MMRHGETERRRMQIQKVLDDASTQEQRNEMGQFATPPELAIQILRYAAERTTNMERVRFLDPGIGTGAFLFGSAFDRSSRTDSVQPRVRDSTGNRRRGKTPVGRRRAKRPAGRLHNRRSSQTRFSVQPPDMQPALRPSPPHRRGKKTSNEAAP